MLNTDFTSNLLVNTVRRPLYLINILRNELAILNHSIINHIQVFILMRKRHRIRCTENVFKSAKPERDNSITLIVIDIFDAVKNIV